MTNETTTALCALTGIGVFALFSGGLEGTDDTRTGEAANAKFAAPVRLMTGDDFLSKGRLYPSPAVYDWNGDGRDDLVVGDLPGRVTVALRAEDGSLGKEERAKLRDDELLDFANW